MFNNILHFTKAWILQGQATYLKSLFLILGVYLPYLLVAIVLWLIFNIRQFKLRLYHFSLLIVSFIISSLSANILRNILDMKRPYANLNLPSPTGVELGYGMPALHMAFLTPVVLSVLEVNVFYGVMLFIGVLIIGVARVLLLVHYPIDILAGVLVGIVSFLIAKLILPKRKKLIRLEKSR